ncbi:PKD domain-containing protein [Candidatus Woesearchaeota archaeon]|nr:PKD domain-containing protein [Candidatus Woesearchaeota archaeon]
MENKKIINSLKIVFAVIMLLLLIKITIPTKTVNGQEPFTVDFKGFAISANPVASYSWDFGDGTKSNEQNPTHIYASAGTYNSVLTITDSSGKTAIDVVTVVVSTANAPPIANAGLDRTSAVSTITQLDGSGSSDPEGAQLTYGWAQISGTSVTLSSTTAQKPSFTATQQGTYEFQLTVYDGELHSQPDKVIITITPSNNQLEISDISITPITSSSGTMFEITATVVDNTQSGVNVAADIHSPGLADDLVLTSQGRNEYMTEWDSANAPSGDHTAEITATSNTPVLTDTASTPFSIEEGAAECAVSASCTAEQTCIFSMNAETNSHASQSCDAAYKVCCPSSKFTSNSCGTTILKLNAASNAHAAEPSTTIAGYSTNICVSPSTTQCANRDGACNADETCIASLAQATASPVYNTHVAKCDYYSLKICCK